MVHPESQPPDNLRDALPEWAARAVASLEAIQRGEPSDRHDLGLEMACWHDPKQGAWVITLPPTASFGVILAALIWPLGMGLVGWSVMGLRSGGGPWWIWGVGIALTLLGCLTLARWSAQRAAPPRDATVVTAEGIVRVDGANHRIAARSDILDVVASEGARAGTDVTKRWTCAVVGPDRRHWCQFSAPVEGDAAPRVGALHDAFVAWHRTGVFSPPEGSGEPKPVQVEAIGKSAAKLLAASAGLALFVWVTMVLPSTSEGGQTASRFVALVGEGDYPASHAMLSKARRADLSPTALEAALSPHLKGATELDVNSISGGVGSARGATQCIDGWLAGVPDRPRFSVQLVSEEDAWRIDGWRKGFCARRAP